ncbi:hypothetical protein MMC19_007080 [Ptychographa xylographoides]|nr:hypothetical protein [Ptychographa xylographoides]
MSSQAREYEIVLLGVTGYTGTYCAEYIVAHLPTDLRWAVAGRNGSKLSKIVDQMTLLDPNRLAPSIEVASLDPEDLDKLTKKTKLLISAVGPFYLYGTPVVEACARNGTHYVDSTGETPWVLEMINKYHDKAKASNAIMIPQDGLESAPPDVMVYMLVSLIRKILSVGVKDIVGTVHELSSLPSGGTLATALGIFGHYGPSAMIAAGKPYALSPFSGPKREQDSWWTRLFGVRYVPDLGILTTGLASGPNTSLVQRSWGLLNRGDYYGHKFQYKEYATVRSAFVGVLAHFAITFGIFALVLPPVGWLVKKFVHRPGEGPTRESTAKDRIEYRAIATADTENNERAFGMVQFDGSAYHLTGILMAEAAMTILRDETLAHRMGGGVLTPATLGQAYVDRLQKAGVKMEARMLDN